MSWYNDDYYQPSKPIKVAGGIRAKSRRGRFGDTWWGQKWIDTLEGFSIGGRLDRGKSYARSGQVLSIDIEKGQVDARVQGSTSRPYRINIDLDAYRASDWKRIASRLADQPYYAARLMGGAMPSDFETIFLSEGLSLFPERGDDLGTDCSCPDGSNPCKHIAAVYYLLAEEFDRDPFLLFLLRGMTRKELLAEILGVSAVNVASKDKDEPVVVEPLEVGSRFWGAGTIPEDFFGNVYKPSLPAALPKRLGNFPFWRGKDGFIDSLAVVYAKASMNAEALFLDDADG
ncbi:MAG: SWIM zinc finger family protein [Rhodothermales bacterium]